MITSIAPVHINVSARLNIGNRLKDRIKSLTHHKKILSMRFHMVHDTKNIVARFHIIFLWYQSKIMIHMMMLNPITRIIFTGNDREIPVLNAGSIKKISLKSHLS